MTTFKKFDSAMKEWGIEYWLMYGTLLDAVRGNANDEDIDIGILEEDMHKVKDFGNGMVHEYYWSYGDRPINVQAWKIMGDSRYYVEADFMQQRLPKVIELKDVEYLGVKCKIPAVYESLLDIWFSNWKVPMEEKARTEIYKIKFDYYENPHSSDSN